MLSKALSIQQENKDAENEAAISDLQSETGKLRESLEKKDNEIISLKAGLVEAKKKNDKAEESLKMDELKIKEQDYTICELHVDLEKVKENIIANKEENAKISETLRHLRDNCFGIASRCCNYLKKILSYVGASSGGNTYASGDVDGALTLAEKELGELKGVINARGDYCVMIES